MPTAAGTGAIPSQTPAVAAAGTGYGYYSVSDARRDIRQATTWAQIVDSLNRIEPRLTWNSPTFQAGLPKKRPTLARQKEYVLYLLSNPDLVGGRRRTKRKHFRKRTSRRS